MTNVIEFEKIAVENSIEGVAVLDEKQEYIYLNRAHVELFGYEHESELIGKSWRILYDDEDQKIIDNKHIKILLKTGNIRFESKGKKKNGDIIYQDVRLNILSNGKMVCMTNDITKRKIQELTINQLALIAKRSEILVAVVNEDFKINWVNDKFSKYTGLSVTDLTNKNIFDLFENNKITSEKLEKIKVSIRSKKKCKIEMFAKLGNNKEYWFEIDLDIFHNKDLKTTNYILSFLNVTKSKFFEQEVKNIIDKEKETIEIQKKFIEIAVHEFRTPLSSIGTSVDLINLNFKSAFKKNSIAPDVMSKLNLYFKKVHSEIGKINTIIDNQLMIGKINSGKFEVKFQENYACAIIAAIVDEERVLKNDFMFNLKVKGQPKLCLIDPILFSQIIRNLFSNTYKYSKNIKIIDLTILYMKDSVTIVVKDYGIGIDKKSLPRIFQPFYRSPNVFYENGVGLGLFIVHSFVNLHKGSIKISSTFGKGTKVTLKFPLFA